MRKKVLFVGVALLGFAIPHQAWATDLTATDDASSPVWGTDTVEITANDGLGTNSFGVRGDGCKIGNLTATTADLTATKGTTCTYVVSDGSVTVTNGVVFAKKPQAALTVSGSGTFLAGARLSTSGGSGTGAITYVTTTSGCSFTSPSSPLLLSSSTSPCAVVATKAADAQYESKASASTDIVMAKANQSTLAISNTSRTLGASSGVTLTTTGGSGSGAVSFTKVSGTCSGTLPVVVGVSSGTCVFTASKAADTTYNATTSAPVTFTWVAGKQPALTITTANSPATTVGSPITLASSGGASGSTVTYTVSGSNCYIADSTVNASGAGKCTVQATSTASGYSDVTTSKVFTFVNADQASFTISSTNTATVASGKTVTTTGGSGSGAVTYAASGVGCNINRTTGVLAKTRTGTCAVTATKAASSGYNATKATQTITFS